VSSFYTLIHSHVSSTYRPSQAPSNIGLASIYIRLLIQSNVLAVSLVQQLDLLRVMQTTREIVWPVYASCEVVPDDLVAMKSAIASIQHATSNTDNIQLDQTHLLKRFGSGMFGQIEEEIHILLSQLDTIRCVYNIFA
jgi:hypothetical protein